MGSRRRHWSWTSALVGAASAAAALTVMAGRPRDPTIHLISINLSSFRLRVPHLDLHLTLAVHVTNPNLVSVRYQPATVSISYRGAHLGSAQVEAGAQPAMSCRLLRLPARLEGVQLAHHAGDILADAARREMELDASVDLAGTARVLFWAHRFSVHVVSHVVVDPVFLDIIEQENTAQTRLYLA